MSIESTLSSINLPHLLPTLALGLSLLDPQLLEKDMCSIKHPTRVSSIHSLLPSERIELARLNAARRAIGVELRMQVPQELRLSHTRTFEVSRVFPADFGAGVQDLDAVGFLSLQMDVTQIRNEVVLGLAVSGLQLGLLGHL